MNLHVNDKPNDNRAAPSALSDRLHEATTAAHDIVDRGIMTANPFASVDTYRNFLKFEHALYRDLEPLYHRAGLAAIFADLKSRSRLSAVERDLADLDMKVPEYDQPPAAEGVPADDIAQALGWLYVIEGSTLGAAFQLKFARELGFTEDHGARHLGPLPQGRAPAWKAFKAALNGVDLSTEKRARAVDGANAAFKRVQALIGQHFG